MDDAHPLPNRRLAGPAAASRSWPIAAPQKRKEKINDTRLRLLRLFLGIYNDDTDETMGSHPMQTAETALPDVKILLPRRIGDERGFFSEVWTARDRTALGLEASFVQDNHVGNTRKGIVRGLHYQIDPAAQGKLVRVVRGAILDIAVDIRRGSPSFGRHAAVELSAANWRQLWVPPGFAHGYCTLEDDTEIVYKVTADYSPAHDRGIAWDDPALGIDWPVARDKALLSARDRALPRLAEQPDVFVWQPGTATRFAAVPGA